MQQLCVNYHFNTFWYILIDQHISQTTNIPYKYLTSYLKLIKMSQPVHDGLDRCLSGCTLLCFHFNRPKKELAVTHVLYPKRLLRLLIRARRHRMNGTILQQERTAPSMLTSVINLISSCITVSSTHMSTRHWKSVPMCKILYRVSRICFNLLGLW